MKGKQMLPIVALVFLLFLSACNSAKQQTITGTKYYYPTNTQSTTEEAKESELQQELYLIVSNDMANKKLVVLELASKNKLRYEYSLTTSFLDKYGNAVATTEFLPGRAVVVGDTDTKGILKKIQLSDAVWEYEDVVRYSIQEERGAFEIADTKYSYDEDLFVVSDEKRITLKELAKEDVLRVVGQDKKILSISVTTGHGVLTFAHTDDFEGWELEVGSKIFATISKDLTIEVPEGVYTLQISKDTQTLRTEVEITRNKKTILDLDELKLHN